MIKAGGDPFSSFLECRSMFVDDSEMRFQLDKVYKAIQLGEQESVAINQFANDIVFPEVDLLKEVLRLGRQEGASLGNALQRLAKVTRQRQSFHRKAKAALALQRLSSIGMLLCALSVLVMQLMANPEAFWRAINHPVGSLVLGAGGGAVVLGVCWMLSLTRGKIGEW